MSCHSLAILREGRPDTDVFSGKGNVSNLLSDGWAECRVCGEPGRTAGMATSGVGLEGAREILVLFLKMSSKFEMM